MPFINLDINALICNVNMVNKYVFTLNYKLNTTAKLLCSNIVSATLII